LRRSGARADGHGAPGYAHEDGGGDGEQTVYALDGTTLDRGLSRFPWARSRAQNAAVKMPTGLDRQGNIPAFIDVQPAKIHEIHTLDELLLAPGSLAMMDRAYLDFQRLSRLQQALAFFIVRARKDFRCPRLAAHPVDKRSGLRCHPTIRLQSFYPAQFYPQRRRRIRYREAQTEKNLLFLTHHFVLPTLTLAPLYQSRGQVEWFFQWVKQPLRIQKFYGLSPHAVKTPTGIAISVYVRWAILRKRLDLGLSLDSMSQILSLTLFEKMPLLQAFSQINASTELAPACNQLDLFNL